MRVLLLYDKYSAGDNRTRINFVLKLAEYAEVVIYGPRENSVFSPIDYNSGLSMTDINRVLQPDVILLLLYNVGCYDWLPYDFPLTDLPSAIIEEDHYESRFDGLVYNDKKVLSWYEEMNFSLLIRRHFYKESAPIPSVWLPFSADEKEFNPGTNDRVNKIGFAGSHMSPQIYYDIRRKAIQTLEDANLLAIEHGRIWDNYVQYLQRYVGCLACTGGMLHTPLAKTFEIPLSGAALLTNKMEEKELFWGKDKCYFEYKDDCSDIVDVAKTILLDRDMVAEVTANALKQVETKHTDSKRIVELYNILNSLVTGTEIPRIWGQ